MKRPGLTENHTKPDMLTQEEVISRAKSAEVPQSLVEFLHAEETYEKGLSIARELDAYKADRSKWTARDHELQEAKYPRKVLEWPLDWTVMYSQGDEDQLGGVTILLGSEVNALRCEEVIVEESPVSLVVSMNDVDPSRPGYPEDLKSFIEGKGPVNLRYKGSDWPHLAVGTSWWYSTIFDFVSIWKMAVVEVVAKVSELKKEKQPWPSVLVHCYWGVNRSSAFAIALIMALERERGVEVDVLEAIRMSLGTYRRALHPWDIRGYFIYALVAFEAWLSENAGSWS